MAITVSTRAGQVSDPVYISAAGSIVTVTPSGGTAFAQYTTSEMDDIKTGNATTWLAWPAGSVSATASDVLSRTCDGASGVHCWHVPL